MKIKISWQNASVAGYGAFLFIKAPWGEYSPLMNLICKKFEILNILCMWGGYTKNHPHDARERYLVEYIRGWEFDFRYESYNLQTFKTYLESEGFIVEDLTPQDWENCA
jgi:hypothetical protein